MEVGVLEKKIQSAGENTLYRSHWEVEGVGSPSETLSNKCVAI